MSGVYGWLGPCKGDPQGTMDSMHRRGAGGAPNARFPRSAPGSHSVPAAPMEPPSLGGSARSGSRSKATRCAATAELASCQPRHFASSSLRHIARSGCAPSIRSARFRNRVDRRRQGRSLFAIDRIGIRNLVYCGDRGAWFRSGFERSGEPSRNGKTARSTGDVQLHVLPYGSRARDGVHRSFASSPRALSASEERLCRHQAVLDTNFRRGP